MPINLQRAQKPLALNWFYRSGRAFLDIILPGRCIHCGILVQEAGALCGSCWGKIRFLKKPCCFACGTPFEFDLGEDALCVDCGVQRPLYYRARSAMIYDDHSNRPVLSFKHGDRTDLAKTFARWLIQTDPDLIEDADYLIPVPLHWRRLFQRRYNQAALLTNELSRLTGKPSLNHVLKRIRATASQGHKSRAAREENVRNAFEVAPKALPLIAEKRILLVDDVMTTGATVSACAKTLLKASAVQIDVLTIARIVHSREIS